MLFRDLYYRYDVVTHTTSIDLPKSPHAFSCSRLFLSSIASSYQLKWLQIVLRNISGSSSAVFNESPEQSKPCSSPRPGSSESTRYYKRCHNFQPLRDFLKGNAPSHDPLCAIDNDTTETRRKVYFKQCKGCRQGASERRRSAQKGGVNRIHLSTHFTFLYLFISSYNASI